MDNLIRPEFLKVGDLIYVCAPSGRLNQTKVDAGIKFLKDSGFRVELGEYLYRNHFKFSAPADERRRDLQRGLDHPDAKAVLCARGGFGLTQVIDELDWSIFTERPKWLLGFSDITALLHEGFQRGFVTMHAPVVQQIPNLNKKSKASLLATLKGEMSSIEGKSSLNKKGAAQGRLVGGNLSLITHLLGSKTQLDYSNCILFIEEVSEPLYAIERMLIQLKRAGILEVINGLAVGIHSGLTEDKTIYGESLEEIVLRLCKNYDYPIAFNLPFGHSVENMTLMHGSCARLVVNSSSSSITSMI